MLEKSLDGEDDGGADLALWPSATKILKELGVGSEEAADRKSVNVLDFWGRRTYPVRHVRICKVHKPAQDALSPPPTTSDFDQSNGGRTNTSAGPGDDQRTINSLLVAAPETVLTKVDMDAVVDGEGEPFRLVGRQAVMSSLVPLLKDGSVRRGVRVIRAEQSLPPVDPMAVAHIVNAMDSVAAPAMTSTNSPSEERITCRVLVGADGIHSVCRMEVSASATRLATLVGEKGAGTASRAAVTAVRATGTRDGGEVCFRGVLDLRDGSTVAAAGLRTLFEEDEKKRPSSMSVVYGDRIRFSWGFIDEARETGYWFVKQLTEKRSGSSTEEEAAQNERPGETWPEPLRTFSRMTGEECSYAHRIQDRPPLDRYLGYYARYSSCNLYALRTIAYANSDGSFRKVHSALRVFSILCNT